MKIVINGCYGGFGISNEALKILGADFNPWEYDNRTDDNLIALIEEKGSAFVSDRYANLVIVEISDETTDWEISEYDGCETVIYVVDGKINHA